MVALIQELADKIWCNAAFHTAADRLELAWLTREIAGVTAMPADLAEADKLMRSAAILACSSAAEHRRAAFRTATSAYEIFGAEKLPFDQALRVVLTRLGNFPSIGTRKDVDGSKSRLPFALAAEEVSSSEEREIEINGRSVLLTDFQQALWRNLVGKRRMAFAAPTSAGKSFLLQGYLSEIFSKSTETNVFYIVPTRALIAQVSEDLARSFKGSDGPSLVTVPSDPESPLPRRAVYIMTQERVQLALEAQPDLSASVVIVDEAHSIADGSRGVLLQWVIDDLLARNPKAQILFASPAIRNLSVFSRLFGLPDIVEFSSLEPTVAQNFLVTNVVSATKGSISITTAGDGSRARRKVVDLDLKQTLASRIDKLVHIPAVLGLGHSNIIYANGADEAEKIALQLAELMSDRVPTPGRLAISELAREVVHKDFVLAHCVRFGIAFHYSNIPTQLRRAIEIAVTSGEIDYLVCTSTLLQGVNLPAKNIFMLMPEKGKTQALEPVDFWNLSGRAGRLRREFQGNIFLIDYDKWKKLPLEGAKDAIIIPAIDSSINERSSELIGVIGAATAERRGNDVNLETAFVRLLSDFKSGHLARTFSRIDVNGGAERSEEIETALAIAHVSVTLPASVLRRSPNISPHKQQQLYEILQAEIAKGGDSARKMVPSHPRESDAFTSYVLILKACHDVILEIDTSKNLHRFHALIALRWMRGTPLPQIIDEQINRNATKSRRSTIRNTLNLIEEQIRFQLVRLMGCYITLLVHALNAAGLVDIVSSIPSLALYLEIGACDKTMLSFVSLGLSRTTAMKLNDLSARKDLDTISALQWLRQRPPATLGLSPLLQAEIETLTTGI